MRQDAKAGRQLALKLPLRASASASSSSSSGEEFGSQSVNKTMALLTEENEFGRKFGNEVASVELTQVSPISKLLKAYLFI